MAQWRVTFQQSGLSSDATGTVLTVGSNTYTYAQLPQTNIWVDDNTAYSYTTTVTSSVTGKQYVSTGVSGGLATPIHAAGSATGNYKTQYRLTMATNFGTVSPATGGWYDAGSTVTIQATAPSAGAGEQYVWAGWTGTGTGSYSGSTPSPSITMNGPITETAAWTHQFWITVTSSHDMPTASAWVTAGQDFATSVTSPDGIWTCTGYSIDGGGSVAGTSYTFINVQAKHTIVFNWVGSGSFGYLIQGSSTSPLDAIRGSRFTCTSAGTAVSISAYLRLQSFTGTFGNTGTSWNGLSIINYIRGQRFSTPAYSVVADSITARIYCSTGSKLMKAAIYDNSGNLIAETNELTVLTDSFSQLRTFTFASPPTLSASTQYILVVWSQSGSGSADLRYDSPTGGNGRIAAQTYGSWPSSVSFTSDNYQYIVYCNYHYDITFQAKAAIYSADGSTFIAGTEEKTLSTIDNWVTFNFVSSPTLAASTNYVLVVWSSDTSNVDIYRDTGTAERFERSVAYGSWPSYVSDQYSQRTYSIYCTYTIP
jgi:hypothetical protein